MVTGETGPHGARALLLAGMDCDDGGACVIHPFLKMAAICA